MDWNAPTLWWLATGALVAVEMTTGTFYLLMLALGCAAGAIAAHAGWAVTPQLVIAALVGGGATAMWHWRRMQMPHGQPAASNADVQIDIGQQLQVPGWNTDGTARVAYRGAQWAVRLMAGHTAVAGPHVIVAVHGAELQLVPAGTAAAAAPLTAAAR
jgi:membrane protein implicated in regulation of membrane protease activity